MEAINYKLREFDKDSEISLKKVLNMQVVSANKCTQEVIFDELKSRKIELEHI